MTPIESMVPGEAMASGAATGDEPDARPATAADAVSNPTSATQSGDTDADPRVNRDAAVDASTAAVTDGNGETVERLAGEVLRYLQRHPNAADTVEGIAQWWIARQRLVETRLQVRKALDRLVARHLVEAADSANGRSRYRLRRDAVPTAASANAGTSAGTSAGANTGANGNAGGAESNVDADIAEPTNSDSAPNAASTSSPPDSSTAEPMTSDRAEHAPASHRPAPAVAPGPHKPRRRPMSPTAKPSSGDD